MKIRLLAFFVAFATASTMSLSLSEKQDKSEKAEQATNDSATKQKESNMSTEVTTDSGLKYVDIEEGSGEVPKAGQRVTVHYVGTLESGEKFDSSIERGPFQFTIGVGQVIKGWDEGIALMKEGGEATLIIPPELGYGSRGAGGVIPPNATLIFRVELLGIR